MKKISFVLCLLALFCFPFFSTAQIDSASEVKLLRLAKKYRYGINTDVCMRKAISIYKALANKGNVVGMRELGYIYLNGDSVKKSYSKAYGLFLKASDYGDAKSLCALADMYREGKGVSLDYNKSFSLYRKAAELGEPHGVYGTGYCYYKGLGVKQDYCQALNYLSLGSEKGHSGCDMLLGNYYSHGYISDSPDFDKAQEFYSKAACRGNGWTLDIIKYGVLDSVKKIRKLQKTRWKNIRKEYFFDDTGLMRRIKSNGKYNISGSYVGTLYTYDWSGKYVEDEKSIVLNMAVKDSVMSFLCYTHDTLYTEFISDKYEHQMWKKTNMLKSERNMSFLPVNVTAEMTAVDTLVVSMEGMNPRNKEKARPMLAVLKKSFLSDVSHSITLENYSINVDFGEGGIDLAITADKKTSILIELYTIEGVKVFDVKKELSAGYNSFTIGATFSAGIYVLKINGKDFKYAKSLVYES